MKNDSNQTRASNPIGYLDDGTFEVLSDGELMDIVGGSSAAAMPSQPNNTGCNEGCAPINSGC